MVTIYYKDNQLDKYRTIKSIGKYYLSEWIQGRKPSHVTVDKSV